jgi:hypothetical protein
MGGSTEYAVDMHRMHAEAEIVLKTGCPLCAQWSVSPVSHVPARCLLPGNATGLRPLCLAYSKEGGTWWLGRLPHVSQLQ